MTLADGDIRKRIKKAISAQKRPTVTILSSLLTAQDELGYIPNEAIEEVAALTGASINEVWGVVSFYTNFRTTPPGEHVVEVCWGPSCRLEGASDILKQMMDDLGLTDEGETKDNKLTLRFNTCLGACSQAPILSLDHRLHGRMTPDAARRLVDGLTSDGS